MIWHDLFYFAKGERSGLIVFLSIVVIAVTILFLTTFQPVSQETQGQDTAAHDTASALTSNDTARSEKEISTAGQTPTATTKIVSPGSGSPATANTTSSNTATAGTKRESVPERVNRLTSYSQPAYTRTEKFTEGTTVELNTADTTTLKKVPGIGSAFAKRIVNYRTILRGYYSVTQLSEVYGIDEERYSALQHWFTADPALIQKIEINTISQDSLQRHPYISYAQARVIIQLRRQKGKLTGWENLQLLNEFTDNDQTRLQPYLSFE